VNYDSIFQTGRVFSFLGLTILTGCAVFTLTGLLLMSMAIGSQLYGRMLSVLRWLTAKGGR
jgi:hypothetical protein